MFGDIVRGIITVAVGNARARYERAYHSARRSGSVRSGTRLDVVVFGCTLCGKYGDHYMVGRATWAEAGFAPEFLACLACLRVHVGRPLELTDFPQHLPINRLLYLGAEIARGGRS